MTNMTEDAKALRFLSVDMIEKAKSGHPGAPLGMADMASVLWQNHLKHSPTNPHWFDRDRFVLSNGHASALLYSLLYLTGYDLSLDEIKNFRQLGSKCAGHPEFGLIPGIETTTGPLGQGFANGVGLALAEKILANEFNRKGFDIVDHKTFVFVGDGCLMEGISHEVASLAGTWKLGKLTVLYDANDISIDGEISPWFSEDTGKRFEAYGWHTITNVDGQDFVQLDAALKTAAMIDDAPSLIICKTKIGAGAPTKAGSAACHGAPLGAEEIAQMRKDLDWDYAEFEIPDRIKQSWNRVEQGEKEVIKWQKLFAAYGQEYPQLASEFERRMKGELSADFHKATGALVKELNGKKLSIASRAASLEAINLLSPLVPEFLGGSADLSPSNLTRGNLAVDFDANTGAGNYVRYGVREFGMSAIMNGLSLHGGFIPFGGTFLIFMEYAKNAVRMAALMNQKVIFVFTHDSIALGEDGATHQPIEQINSLRMTPNINTWRPCDSVETLVAWQKAVEANKPSALILSRQNLAHQQRDEKSLAAIEKGAYILTKNTETPEIIFIATGSEVELARQVAEELAQTDIGYFLVSMPSSEVFDAQSQEYKDSVLPKNVQKRVALEAGNKDFWYKYVGLNGLVIGIDTFGESGKGDDLMAHFGFSKDGVLQKVKQLLED